MTRRSLLAMTLVLVAVPALVSAAGGWAIITVDDLPEYLVAGEPTEIAFTIRQHGLVALDRLSPSVEAKSGWKKATVQAVRGNVPGRYTARVMVPETGDWTLTIQSGFGPSHSKLLPITAVGSRAAPLPPVPAADRGARLFVAKGCVGCHMHGMIDRPQIAAVGPELTARRYPPDYLGKLLGDPATVQAVRPGFRMPNLGLRPAEIGALVAFINADPPPARK